MRDFLYIVFSTLLSEDITCIGVGILIQEGKLDPVISVLACTIGIFLGDFLLFLSGKELHSFLRKRASFQFIFESEFFEATSEKLKNHFAKTILLSRFMPGTRLPIYTFAGMISKLTLPFLQYTFIASLLWTPSMIFLAFKYGESFKKIYDTNLFYLYLLFAVSSFFLLYQILIILLQRERRRDFFLGLCKINKLEYWPTWIFYLPLLPYACYLIVRYGTIKNVTTSNPGIPFGGIALESKAQILSQLQSEKIAKFYLLSESNPSPFQEQIKKGITHCGNSFPIILKPDVGERGAGVKLVKDMDSIPLYFKESPVDTILQEYHAGPYEAGIFYYRLPNSENGRILSITDKIFPYLIGDGKSNIKELIYGHSRYRFQAKTFLKRMKGEWGNIPKMDERISLGFAGNHIQGCMFKDGSHLFSSRLEDEIDTISKTFSGFFFGRYDIRYSSIEDLKMGRNFKIIELNGAMSESTNLYDPSFTIFQSYGILFRQWRLLFEIGAQNRKNGTAYPTWKSFFVMLNDYQKYKKKIDPIAQSIGNTSTI
jgi:membrane protein DedA with SNARE-associated domain